MNTSPTTPNIDSSTASTFVLGTIKHEHHGWLQSAYNLRLGIVLLLIFAGEAFLFTGLYYQYVIQYPFALPKLPVGVTVEDIFLQEYLRCEMFQRVSWALYGLLIVSMTRVFPVTGRNTWRNVALHIICALLINVLHGLASIWVGQHVAPTFPMTFSQYVRGTGGVFLGCIHYVGLVLWAELEVSRRQYHIESLRSLQLKTDLAQSQLHALKMQLQPHFLFNALNSISALLYEDIHRADEMIARLGDFLRMTLENPSTQFISLEQEFDLLQCYVDIEMLRFPNRLDVEIQMEQGLQDAEVPNLLLQPLVENAIKYGALQHTSCSRIMIIARRLDTNPDLLEIIVRDNGPGVVSNEIHHRHTTPSRGGRLTKKYSIGIYTTHERLRKLYGANAEENNIEQHYRFSTYNAPEGGFVVHIQLPFRVVKKEDAKTQKLHSTFYKKENE